MPAWVKAYIISTIFSYGNMYRSIVCMTHLYRDSVGYIKIINKQLDIIIHEKELKDLW